MTTHIETPELDQLSELHSKAQIREASLAVIRAEFQLAAVKLFVKHGFNSQTHAICLHCGAFNLQSVACACAMAAP